MYPSADAWDPLINAAVAHPDLTFIAIVNPSTGPGSGSCPNTDYINATSHLSALSNVKTLGYVHTANAWNCGSSGADICTCSAPLADVTANITTYQLWPTSCANAAVKVDGIFFDEAPSNGTCLSYMTSAAGFARTAFPQSTLMFNPGTSVNSSYWSLADYINVFENAASAYSDSLASSLDGNGDYTAKASAIMYGYTGGQTALASYVASIASKVFSSLLVSDISTYTQFPTNWAAFVDAVAEANAA